MLHCCDVYVAISWYLLGKTSKKKSCIRVCWLSEALALGWIPVPLDTSWLPVTPFSMLKQAKLNSSWGQIHNSLYRQSGVNIPIWGSARHWISTFLLWKLCYVLVGISAPSFSWPLCFSRLPACACPTDISAVMWFSDKHVEVYSMSVCLKALLYFQVLLCTGRVKKLCEGWILAQL